MPRTTCLFDYHPSSPFIVLFVVNRIIDGYLPVTGCRLKSLVDDMMTGSLDDFSQSFAVVTMIKIDLLKHRFAVDVNKNSYLNAYAFVKNRYVYK